MRVLLVLLLALPGSLVAQPVAQVDALARAARGADARSVAARVALAQRLAGTAPDSAEALAAQAVRLANALGTDGLCADANGVLADVQTARGALDEAMEAYGRARECASGDPGREARAHAGLGMIYAMQGRYPMARDEYDRALSLRQATGDRGAVAETQGKLAALALDQGQPADAERFAREALSTAGRDAPVSVRIHLGEALRRQRRAPEALSTLRDALADASGAGQRADESAALSALARTASDLGQHDDARGFARRAIASAGAFPQARSEATRTLALVLNASGDPGAFDALLGHLAVRDSVMAATSTRRLNAAQAAFGLREREREIDHLEIESEVQALALSRTRATVAAAILGALLLLGVAVGLWRQRQGQARRLREKERQVE
ncbi:MAG: tetratricopeptide repeat protein, partial [Bacteroidota bacterium]